MTEAKQLHADDAEATTKMLRRRAQTRLLCIEDNEALANLLRRRLQKHGYMVDMATSGREGLAKVKTEPYDLVTVDYYLPDMSGVDILRALNKMDQPIPVIMVSGAGDLDVALNALRLGAADYVIKEPGADFFELLLNTIETVLNHRHLAMEKEQAQIAQKESEKRFRDFAETSSDWFWEMDENLKFSYFSDRYADITGIPVRTHLDECKLENLTPDIDPDLWKTHMATLNARQPFQFFVYPHSNPNGRTVWLSINGKPVFDSQEKFVGYRGTGSDVTEQRAVEAQLIQSAKLASLGEMATGTAHEINQPLNIIRMASDSLIELIEEGMTPSAEDLKPRLDRISAQAVRAAKIIDRMRVFGRTPKGDVGSISPGDAVMGAAGFLGEQLRLSEIELNLDIPEACRPVKGDLIQFEQVIMNLLTNARDAIEEKMQTAVKSNNPEQINVKIQDDPEAGVIKLTVIDTGGGIQEDAISQVFEPFFTTKEIGSGTGVGLSISYGIITEMGGTITAENIATGAKFSVTLPAVS